MILGERLRQLRKDKYSQEELAELLHVHNNTVSKWETGEMEPRVKRVTELAKLLNTTSAYLLGDTDDPKPIQGTLMNDYKKDVSKPPMSDEKQRPYKEFKVNRGTLVYEFGNGRKLEVPDTPETAPQFWARVDRLIGLQPSAATA